jgi:arginyl-tRNA synthetase
MFDHLSSEAKQILETLYGLTDIDVMWQRPAEASHGDLSTSIALRLGKSLNKKPQEIAKELASKLEASPSVAKAEVAGPGYVNLWLTPAALLDQMITVERACAPAKEKSADPVIIDYSQPNIAKPLGIHHILSTVIGQSIGNLYEHAGTPVIRWNYIGDWGTQFGKLAVAFEKWGKKPARDCTMDELLELYVRFHQEAEKDESLEDEGRAAFLRLEKGDKELRAFWEDVLTVTKASLNDIYKRLNVHFDLDTGESYYEDKMAPVIEEGKKKNVFTEGEKGALIAVFPEDTNMPPAIVVKGDGATIYLTRDLAMMKDRIERFHPQEILFVVDVAQSLHFKQLFAIVEKLEWKLPRLEHVFFGRMSFAEKSMSTRKGNILKLEHVLDEAVARAEEIIKERGDSIQTDNPQDLAEMMGVGSLVYGILSQNRKMNMVFDWDKMLSFEGNSAPYLQYTHARARSVLRKGGVKKEPVAITDGVDSFTANERLLLMSLLQFPSVLEDARRELLPHKLATYLHQLCQDYNLFYNTETILTAEEPQRALRLALTALTAAVLKSGTSILTIRVPDRM